MEEQELERLIYRLKNGGELSSGDAKQILFLRENLGYYNLIRKLFEDYTNEELKTLYLEESETIDKF
ncbi:MAG: hypothetical protein U9R37_02495 [Campylobacterota bacterium]|nr:hypothetical protein [Campylobacterota bacterium]